MFRLACPSSAVPQKSEQICSQKSEQIFPCVGYVLFFLSFPPPPPPPPLWFALMKRLKLVISDSDCHNCDSPGGELINCVVCVVFFSGDHIKGGIWSYGEPAPRGTAVCPRGIWVSTSVFYLWLGVHFSALRSKKAWCVSQVGGNYRIYRANAQRRVESDQKYLMLATLFMSFIVGIIYFLLSNYDTHTPHLVQVYCIMCSIHVHCIISDLYISINKQGS